MDRDNMTTPCQYIQTCRVCGSEKLTTVLELGEQPLANALKQTADGSESKFSLTLAYCGDCGLVQLRETVDKELLFSNYTWVTGTSATTRSYAKLFCQRTIETARPDPDDLILEVASNDGTLLMPFLEGGYGNILGVDPASNIAELANQRGVRTLNEFWNEEVAQATVKQFGHAKIAIARNVIPHVSELHDVIRGLRHVLRDDGVAVLEVHYAGQILQELHYDSIYHEHLCYFSINSLAHLLEMYGLSPYHIDTSPISGGSYVIYFSKGGSQESEEYLSLLEQESQLGVHELHAWQQFAEASQAHREESLRLVDSLGDKRVLGFGSSARSSTYLNFCGFQVDQIRAIIDNNPLKQGMYAPGTSIPILSMESGMEMEPELIFILAWNFGQEIAEECRRNGYKGGFWVPFPHCPHELAIYV